MLPRQQQVAWCVVNESGSSRSSSLFFVSFGGVARSWQARKKLPLSKQEIDRGYSDWVLLYFFEDTRSESTIGRRYKVIGNLFLLATS